MTTLDHFFHKKILCKKKKSQPLFLWPKKTLANAGASLLGRVKWYVHTILDDKV